MRYKDKEGIWERLQASKTKIVIFLRVCRMWNSSEISSEILGQGVKTRVYFALKFYLLLNT